MRKPKRRSRGWPASSPAQRRTREWKPSAPTIQRDGMKPSAMETPSEQMPVTGVPHSVRTPAAAACSTIFRCKTVRHTPNAEPSGNPASTETPAPRNRMPRNGCASAESRAMPRLPSAARPSGIMPSPQALSIGGRAPSARVTSSPLRRAAMAAARPAGPPPITNTSVARMSDGSVFQPFQILEALTQGLYRVAWSVVLLDKIVLHSGFFRVAQPRRYIHRAVAILAKFFVLFLLVIVGLDGLFDVLQV